MKILLVHNKYKQSGGEDFIFRAEHQLLLDHGHQVECLLFDNAGIRNVIHKCLAGLKALYNPASAHALKKKIETFDPDVIHIHNLFPLASPSILFVAGRYHVPVVITLHNYRLICPSAFLFYNGRIYEKSIHSLFPVDAVLRGVYRNSMFQTAATAFTTAVHNMLGTWRNKVDLYISLTRFARNKFVHSALSMPGKKVVVKPNSVADYGEGEAVRQNFFLFAGRLSEEKGIRTLLGATTLFNFKLIIIGDGPLRNMVEDFARKNPNIRYLGFQDNATVINYMKTCKALLFPSIWYEGLPVTILQAFSTGTVVLASRLGSMAEIIRDQVNGLHFRAGSEVDLVTRIIDILGHRIDIRQISANARATYLECYTPERNYDTLIRAYRYVVSLKKQSQTAPVKRKPVLQLKST